MKCMATTKAGNPCGSWAIKGGTVCGKHGGSAPQVKAMAAVRAEVSKWQLGDAVDDPGEVLLRLLTQSRIRADMLAAELERQQSESGCTLSELLVGTTIVLDPQGGEHESGEYIRGLVQLEGQERDRCASFAAKAIAAGLAERQVRLAERQADMVSRLFAAVVGDAELGLTPEQKKAMPNALRRHLTAVTA